MGSGETGRPESRGGFNMIGLASINNGVGKKVYLLQKQAYPDGSVEYDVQKYYFALIQDSRQETRNDYNPDGVFAVRLVRFTQKGIPILELLARIEDVEFLEVFTAGLPWKILIDIKTLQETSHFIPGADPSMWEVMWKVFKEKCLSKDEKDLAINRLNYYYKRGLIDKEDLDYYLEFIQNCKETSQKEETEVFDSIEN
jgi:hypothetical protein